MGGERTRVVADFLFLGSRGIDEAVESASEYRTPDARSENSDPFAHRLGIVSEHDGQESTRMH